MSDLLATSWWAGASLWAVVYLSDYYLTIYVARIYRRGADQHYEIEGSYELTPVFQNDVDNLRWFSPTFAKYFVGTGLALLALQYLGQRARLPDLYLVGLGALVVVEVPIHLRLLRNLLTFHGASSGHVKGKISYPRWLTLRTSAIEFGVFALLFFGVFAVTRDWMVLGGAMKTALTAGSHWSMCVKARAASADKIS